MNLSFEKGTPCAQIVGGKYNGQIIYTDLAKEDKNDTKNDPILLLGEEFFSQQKVNNKKLKLDDLVELSNALRSRVTPKNPKLISIYADAIKIFDDKKKTEFKLDVGQMKPVPNPDGRQCLYIAGPSGAGKSTYTSMYCSQWKKMFPDRSIYLFSAVNEDKALDVLEPSRIAIDATLNESKLQPENFRDSLVIFDDIDVIPDKKLRDEVFRIQDQLLQTGRHTNTYVVSTSHQLVNYNKTKILLGEAHQITVFPNGSNLTEPFRRFLEKHCGFSKAIIKKISELKSRWITVNKAYPQYVLFETGIFIC